MRRYMGVCECMPSVFIVANPVLFTNLGTEAYPADIRITSVQMTSIDLDWRDWTFQKFPVRGISGFYVRVRSTFTSKLYDLHDTITFTFKATHLEPATEYTVSVVALTMKGSKHYLSPVQVTTLPRGECMHVFVSVNELPLYFLDCTAYFLCT